MAVVPKDWHMPRLRPKRVERLCLALLRQVLSHDLFKILYTQHPAKFDIGRGLCYICPHYN